MITRTFITSSGVPFTPGDVCVFEGLNHVRSVAQKWFATQLLDEAAAEKSRLASKHGMDGRAMFDLDAVPDDHFVASPTRPAARATFSYGTEDEVGDVDDPTGLTIWVSEPIVDRKSSFVGRAVRISNEKQVPLVIHEILSDKRVARAAHPAIFAYRVTKDVGGLAGTVIDTGQCLQVDITKCIDEADYDDDGESQAGARLRHLLEILELEDVLVVVSRWYGGILLGADRFKHVNQAARDALELGGFLYEKSSSKGSRRK